MTAYINDYIQTIKRNLGDPINISQEIYQQSISQAARIYSRYFPIEVVSDIPGENGFNLTLPVAFMDGFSTINSIEYPYIASQQNPNLIKLNEARPYRTPTGLQIRFMTYSPKSTEVVRLNYTVPHTITTTTSTIPSFREDAIGNKASALVAEIIAADYSNTSRSSMDEISIDFRIKSQEWQLIADRYNMLFRTDLGLPEKTDEIPYSGWIDLDFGYSAGVDWLTHPRRWR
jgi:hypothetical protein